jgi:opacity protein-like surface antigen
MGHTSKTTVTACAMLFSVGAVSAQPSEDLVFCSKLQDSRERIACYDAAARIAARRNARPAPVAAPRPSIVAPAHAPQDAMAAAPAFTDPTLPLRSPFDGLYVAGGGSYGVSTSRSFNIRNEVAPFTNSFFLGQSTFPSGGSLFGVAGYNLTMGSLLLGIEASGRWGNEAAEITLPQSASAFGNVFGTSSMTYRLENDVGAHLAIRLGGFIDNTLVFGTIGVGVTRLAETFNVDNTNAFVCSAFTLPVPPSFTQNCIQFQFGGTGSFTSEKWIPSLVLGAGIEQNIFGRFFVRLSAEAETIGPQNFSFGPILLSPGRRTSATTGADQGPGPGGSFSGGASSDTFWTGRAQGAVGFRF